MEAIYLDNNATTPLYPSVKRAIIDALELWGNPSSSNCFGEHAQRAIEDSRSKLGKLFSDDASNVDVYFTSGGTETNNWIISAAIEGFSCEGKKRVIISAIEHPSVQNPLRERETKGEIELIELPIDALSGCVDLGYLANLLDGNTCLVSVMLANNETGVYQPLEKISQIVRSSKFSEHIVLHSDVAQVVGKRRVDLRKLGVDVITVVGHKFGGPRIGALVKNSKRNISLKPLLYGGGQENGYRSGTENTPMVVGLGAAAEEAACPEKYEILLENRRSFEAELKRVFGDSVRINFESSDRLENTTSASFLNSQINACEIVEKAKSFIASTGAACHEKQPENASSITPSAVLLSCGLCDREALRTIRFSFGTKSICPEDISRIVEELRVLTA